MRRSQNANLVKFVLPRGETKYALKVMGPREVLLRYDDTAISIPLRHVGHACTIFEEKRESYSEVPGFELIHQR